MDKTARELLEESVTYFTHPVAELADGTTMTGWAKESELARRTLPYGAKVLDEDAKDLFGYYQGVCAIGAISLASLGRNLGINPDSYIDWDVQVNNPEVAYATLALAWTLYNKFPTIYGPIIRSRASRNMFDPGAWAEEFMAGLGNISKWSNETKTKRAQALVNMVTGFNDSENTTLSQMVDLFNSTIKNLIAVEEAV